MTDVIQALKTIQPRQRVVYHTGTHLYAGGFRSDVADTAWDMHTKGKAHLVQERLGNGKFAYIAVGCGH